MDFIQNEAKEQLQQLKSLVSQPRQVRLHANCLPGVFAAEAIAGCLSGPQFGNGRAFSPDHMEISNGVYYQ